MDEAEALAKALAVAQAELNVLTIERTNTLNETAAQLSRLTSRRDEKIARLDLQIFNKEAEIASMQP